MRTILLIIVLFLSSNVFAGDFKVNTGLGYITDKNGNIVAKAQYPLGTVTLTDGYTYQDVADQATLDLVKTHVDTLDPTTAFSAEKFSQDLLDVLGGDPEMFQYYAVFKDLAIHKNFTAMKNMRDLLLSEGLISQDEFNDLSIILAKQSIVLG